MKEIKKKYEERKKAEEKQKKQKKEQKQEQKQVKEETEKASDYKYNKESETIEIQIGNSIETVKVAEADKEKLEIPVNLERYVSLYKTLTEVGLSGLWSYIGQISNAI
jgi:hypothetical protein